MNDQTEWEIDNAIAEEGMFPDLGPYPMTPQTPAGRALHDSRHGAKGIDPISCDDPDCAFVRKVEAIEREAKQQERERIRTRLIYWDGDAIDDEAIDGILFSTPDASEPTEDERLKEIGREFVRGMNSLAEPERPNEDAVRRLHR